MKKCPWFYLLNSPWLDPGKKKNGMIKAPQTTNGPKKKINYPNHEGSHKEVSRLLNPLKIINIWGQSSGDLFDFLLFRKK
jgi:hypothetical protein